MRKITVLLPKKVKKDQFWIDIVSDLPASLSPVTFRLKALDTTLIGSRRRPPNSNTTVRVSGLSYRPTVQTLFDNRPKAFKDRLWSLDILSKRVVRNIPNAATSIGRDAGFDSFSPVEQAAMEAVMTDIER